MRSRWINLKKTALVSRRSGDSIRDIESRLGIPRSTLSGWFRDINLPAESKLRLKQNKEDGLKLARVKAAEWHREQKALRLERARMDAEITLSQLELTAPILDLALAMLY